MNRLSPFKDVLRLLCNIFQRKSGVLAVPENRIINLYEKLRESIILIWETLCVIVYI